MEDEAGGGVARLADAMGLDMPLIFSLPLSSVLVLYPLIGVLGWVSMMRRCYVWKQCTKQCFGLILNKDLLSISGLVSSAGLTSRSAPTIGIT